MSPARELTLVAGDRLGERSPRPHSQYFAGSRTTFDLPLDFVGTDFQVSVWHELLAIVAPCHRVIGASGKLTGFAGGLEAKALLLDLERRGTTFDFGDREARG